MGEMVPAGLAIRSVDTDPIQFAEHARRAEELGFGSIWVTEELARSGFTVLATASLKTHKITLGTAIVSIYSRTPLTMALEYIAMNEASSGRFILGLGAGGPDITARGHGIEPAHPVERMAEYLRIIRRLLSGERFTYQGRFFKLSDIRIWASPPSTVRIYVAALNPLMLRLAGALADGVILNMFSPSLIGYIHENLRSGEASRKVEICSFVPAAATSEEASIEALKKAIGFYAATPTYRRMFRLMGFGQVPERVYQVLREGGRERVAEVIPDQLVEATSIICDRDDVGEKLERFREVGVTPLVYPQPRREKRGEDIKRVMDAVAMSILNNGVI
ncbi:MAG: LLM class flavin-dependent oxidoreductase [Nitrososphaerota archaeon]